MTDDGRTIEALRDLVARSLPEILGADGAGATATRIDVSRPLRSLRSRHHRLVHVDYESRGRPGSCKIWLKFRDDFDGAFDIHRRIYGAAGYDATFLPRPYFLHRLEEPPLSVVAMEYVSGTRLRTAVIAGALGHGRERLVGAFGHLGKQLRSFHDALAMPATRTIADRMAVMEQAIGDSRYFAAGERQALLRHAGHAAGLIGRDAGLRVTQTHGDLAVRNVMQRPDGRLTLIDCDSLHRRQDSGWCDVAHLLINIESLTRYSPFFPPRLLARLSRAVCAGYRGSGFPDGLTQEQVHALIYLLKIERALGLHGRRPLFAKLATTSGRRYLRRFKADLVRGVHGTLGLQGLAVPESLSADA